MSSYLDNLVHLYATGPLDRTNNYGDGALSDPRSFRMRVESASRRPYVWPLLQDGFNFVIPKADIRPLREAIICFLTDGLANGYLPTGNTVGVLPQSVNNLVADIHYDRTAIQVIQDKGFSPIVNLSGIDSMCLWNLIFIQNRTPVPNDQILPILDQVRRADILLQQADDLLKTKRAAARSEHAALIRAIESHQN